MAVTDEALCHPDIWAGTPLKSSSWGAKCELMRGLGVVFLMDYQVDFKNHATTVSTLNPKFCRFYSVLSTQACRRFDYLF